MALPKSGTDISLCSVTGINDLGLWILVDDKEYFIPFSDYPVFREASISKILNVGFYPPYQLHWKEIDIDIELQALNQPESFPLIYRT